MTGRPFENERAFKGTPVLLLTCIGQPAHAMLPCLDSNVSVIVERPVWVTER